MSMSLDDETRAEVEQRVKRRVKFYRDLASYVTTNLILWGIWFVTGGGSGTPWPLFVTFFWGIGLVSEFSKVFVQDTLLKDVEQREMARELARARQDMGDEWDAEKPKRKNVALGEDGELVYEDEEEARAAEIKRKNQG